MDAQQFLAAFGYIANAPGGVARLREMVLYLAISGKIVQQDLSEEHAEKLLQRIRQHAANVTSKKRGKSIKKIGNNQNSNETNIPPGWVIVELGEVGDWGAGSTPPRNNPLYYGGSIPWFKSGELKSDYITRAEEHISELALRECSLRLNVAGDVLIAMYGANIGQCSIVGIESTTNQAVCACTPYEGVSNRFLLLTLRAKTRYFMGLGAGGAQPNISKEKIITTHIGLPPTEEQSRIVAKVDELMALCDRLEAQQQARRKLQNALRQSTLQAVASAASPHELQEGWKRLADHFGQLFTAPEDVDDVIAGLKSLAIRGLLTETSEIAPDLSRIKADCAQLRDQYISDGLLRRQKLVGMAECETIYPDHWVITSFDEVAVVIGGITKGRDLRGRQVIVCPYLAVANVQRGYFKLDALKTIEIAADELEKYRVQEGDLLITEGGDWDKVGRTAIWRGGVTNCLHQNHVFKARVPSKLILNEWVELVFNSDVGRDYFAGASKQTTNLASINMTQLRSFPLPIPPREEQRRILSVLTRLIAQCTEWRQLRHRKESLSALLANAFVSAFTNITTGQQQKPTPPHP